MNSKPPLRSQSVGSIPRQKRHTTSRVESASGASLDVRCACQYYQSDSLLPERINPVGSRPESNIGFVNQDLSTFGSRTANEFFVERPGIQYDQMSVRSCAIGHGLHPDVEKVPSKILASLPSKDLATDTQQNAPLDAQQLPSKKGLVVRSISDATDPEFMPPPWKQRALSIDRLSQRSFGMRDPDTISTRSMGLRRISRTPSKTDLFVADINISATNAPASRRGSRMEIPQFNFIAPTPTMEMKHPFSVYEEFRKNKELSEKETENKENMPVSVETCKPTDKTSKDSFPPDPGQSPSSLASQPTIFSAQPLAETNQSVDYQQERQRTGDYQQERQRSGDYHQEHQSTSDYQQEHQKTGDYQQERQRTGGYHQEHQSTSDYQQERQRTGDYQQERQKTGGYHQEHQSTSDYQQEHQKTLTDIPKLKRQQAPDLYHALGEMSSDFSMEVEDIPPKVENQPKQESSSFIKSLFKSNKSSEPTDTSEGSAKDETFSFKSFFKSSKPVETAEPVFEHVPKEETLKSVLKPSKPMEIPKEIKSEEISIISAAVPIKQVELVVVEEEEKIPERTKPLVIDTAIKAVTPYEAMETFSLKVDDLDQYAFKPKVVAPVPIKTTQKLKVSSIDLSRVSPSLDERRSRQHTPLPFPQPVVVDPTISKPYLFKRSDILRSSQPELSMQGNKDNTSMRKSETPLRQGNLISVPIDVPEPPIVSEEATNEEFFKEQSEQPIESSSPADISIEQKINTNVIQEIPRVEDKTLAQSPPAPAAIRSTSRERMMQSKLLQRKDYFNRTQSQDRTLQPRSQRGSMGDLQSGSLVKTVSFDFGGHQSRFTSHEKETTNRLRDKKDWIERTYFTRDHEYEPIGEPVDSRTTTTTTQPIEKSSQSQENESSPVTTIPTPTVEVSEPMEVDEKKPTSEEELPKDIQDVEMKSEENTAEEFQRDVEERYFSSTPTTPRTESRTDYEIHTSQVDSSALEELPLKPESRKKGFMASAQDKSRKVHANLRNQAGKIKTKFRGMKKPSGSPKAKERRRFKAPEFTKMKLPDIKRPEIPKFKKPEFKKIEFKRPEFTKFNKPDMSKFKIPEKFSSLKLTRSKSLKEPPATSVETQSGTTPESAAATPVKKRFEFNFSTYPRVLRKKKDKIANQVVARADDVPSSETPPSFESASVTIPRGARDKGPVGSRWADKFSDVSYGDNESGKYQRYGSEVESSVERGERDSSLERRMKEDLDRRTEQEEKEEEQEISILGTVEQKQFADYDEENRAIHEISKSREGEFKKRHPMVHQISDLSEESKEVGWTERDILRNKILRGTDAEAEAENYPSEEGLTGSLTNTNQETQSTGSSGPLRQKGVLEEIDDDQFFLRKRGISQDNIEIRQYISTAIREGFDTPVNALAQLGDSQGIYPDDIDISGQINYGYDVPPPKPRRIKYKYDTNIDSAEISQEFDIEQKENYDDNISLPKTGSDYFKNLPPSRPLRKSKKQYSQDSQEVPESEIPYFDEDEQLFYKKEENNNLDIPEIIKTFHPVEDIDESKTETPPKAPKRRKKQLHESIEKDSFVNGFGGRSISNTFLPEENQMEELIVYRTEHEYIIPLAQAETFTTPTPPTRSRSRSRFEDDDRTSRGADSAVLDIQQEDEKFFVEMKENDGYAVVRKEPPPRPPPPMRRKRSPNFRDDKFATMPHLRTEIPPERPKRNYSTIGPSRPPRRKSSASIEETREPTRIPDVIQYEELDIEDIERPESPRNLISGDVINKMKHRPLPPPPRPPRDHKHKYKDNDEKFDKDEGAEKIVFDLQQNGNYEIDKTVEKCIEVEVSTQTDPLPDDFVCEEFEITDDMKIIEPRRSKTLEDILKEEQEAEIERAKQLAEDETLTRSIQKFRDAGQRSYSEKSRGSTAERSRTQSRPNTPSAVVIEKRVPTPIPNKVNETMLTASLIVQPVDDFDLDEDLAREFRSEEKLEEQVTKSDVSSQKQEEEERLTVDYSSDQRSVISEAKTLDQETEKPSSYEASLKDEQLTEDLASQEEGTKFESEPEEPPPQPPPRKRSSVHTEDSSALVPRDEEPIESTLSVVPEQTPASTEVTSSTKLAIADLEVERLSVHALQAGRIMVSELQGAQISADELECKSGNLVVRNMEFPPGFIEQIIERVRSTERDHSQAQTQTIEPEEVRTPTTPQEQIPARPPPPQQVYPSEDIQYSIPPPSFYQLRSPSEEENPQYFPVPRRRRHHRRRDSSDEDDYLRERRRSRQGTRSPEPTVSQLGGQLLRLCGSNLLRTMNQIVNYLQTAQKEGTDRNISTAMILLVLMAFGLLMLGLSGKNIHHHHWDFFNPPGNEGRNQ